MDSWVKMVLEFQAISELNLSPVFLREYCLLMTLLPNFLVNFLGVFLEVSQISKNRTIIIQIGKKYWDLEICRKILYHF